MNNWKIHQLHSRLDMYAETLAFLDTFLTLTMFYRESYLESYLELLSTQVPDDANAASGDRLLKASGDREQDFPDWPCKTLWGTDALSSNFHKRQTIQL